MYGGKISADRRREPAGGEDFGQRFRLGYSAEVYERARAAKSRTERGRNIECVDRGDRFISQATATLPINAIVLAIFTIKAAVGTLIGR
jgi:hypothetical protein